MPLVHDCDYEHLVRPGLVLLTLFALATDVVRQIRGGDEFLQSPLVALPAEGDGSPAGEQP